MGDEDGRVLLGGPDDVDFLGGFVSVLKLSFDSAGYCGPTVGQRWNEADYHIRLVDQQKITGVYLAVDVAFDLLDLAQVQPNFSPQGRRFDKI